MSKIAVTVAVLLLALSAAVAQTTPPAGAASAPTPGSHSYRLDFVIHELDGGKRINARSYTTIWTDGPEWGSLRTGSRVPVPAGKDGSFQYMDVGVNIDLALREREAGLLLETRMEISSLPDQTNLAASGGLPITRQTRFAARAFLNPGKPTLIWSGDEVTSTRRFEVEVTATQLK